MRAIALFLTVLTGFSGLVYQVAWQKHLAALLGSHSEATAAVLGIFLGGLAYGYRLFGRVSRRLMQRAPGSDHTSSVLMAYGLVEAGIGIYALCFGPLFSAAQVVSLGLPAGSEGLAFAFDVGLTALLIGPPTILMGGTIPLLTQGLSRDLRDSTKLHAWVYAFNTTGAFLGALCAGFVLVPMLGLHYSVICMGAINLLAGAVFIVLARWRRNAPAGALPSLAPSVDVGPADEDSGSRPGRGLGALSAVALLSGFAMMTLQTTINRIGALSIGASQFTFSMVVATFVLSIALGSFAVSLLPRIRREVLPITQWLLVGYLLCLYPFVEDAPYWAHRVRILFGVDEVAFLPFHGAVLLAGLAVLIIPLGISGALLPLIFHEVRRRTSDLGGVAGSLYSWNTVGSLVGALLGGYALLFWLDLHHVYRLAVLAVAAVALLLTVRLIATSPRSLALAGGSFALVAVLLSLQPPWSAAKLSSGLFRIRQPFEYSYTGPDRLFELKRRDLGDGFVRFYQDDPVASIAVLEPSPGALSIVTNGKSDGNIPADNMTQGLLALLPALVARGGERAFVIGYGTGMSVGEIAALDSFEEVVVAEIAPAVMEAAILFEGMNRGALSNPKTRLVRSDAYRALLRSVGTFDVIVSEPSNPWVTGVEMLYSREFLRAARKRLAPGGVFAQWFHIYESSDESVALVLRTYLAAFDRVAVWHGAAPDLILLGFAEAEGAVDLGRLEARFERPDFRRQLKALGIESFPRLLAHELLPAGVLSGASIPGSIHTLGHPRLSEAAARAFFVGKEGTLPTFPEVDTARSIWLRYRDRFVGGRPPDEERLEFLRETCLDSLPRCSTLFAHWLYEDPASPVLAASLAKARGSARLRDALAPSRLSRLAALFAGPGAPSGETRRADYGRYFHHAAPFHRRPRDVEPVTTRTASSG